MSHHPSSANREEPKCSEATCLEIPASFVEDSDGTQWMLEFQGGNDLSFDRIVACYRPRILNFLRRTLRDSARAEDLTQEVFVRVFRSRARYKATASFRTWLFTIASRLALNEARTLRRRRRVFAEVSSSVSFSGSLSNADAADGCDEFWANVPDPKSEAPFHSLQRKELEEVIEALLDDLPGNQRAALELQQGEQLSYCEIAETLGVSTMAVKSLLLRARENLRAGLQGYLKEQAPRKKDKISRKNP